MRIATELALAGVKRRSVTPTPILWPAAALKRGLAAAGSSVSQGHPAIPIIAISGYFSLSGSSAEAVLALGAARVLAKPVERSAIMQAVAELVGTPHR